MLWKPFSGTHHVTSSCNLSSLIYKGLESPFFLFRLLTKLPHPNTIYRYIWPGAGGGVLALEHVFSRATGATAHFVNRRYGVQTFKLGPRGNGDSE